MSDVIATYRGYPVHLSLGVNWSFTATPLTPDRPILARAEWGNWHAELGADGKDYRADFVHALLAFRKFSAVGCLRAEKPQPERYRHDCYLQKDPHSIRRLVNGRHTGLCRRLADNSRGD